MLMKMRLTRLMLFLFTLIIGLFICAGTVHAQIADPDPPFEEEKLDCRECHWEIHLDWEQSVHGRGLSCGQCHLADQQNHSRKGHGAQEGPEQCMNCHTTGYNAEDDTWEEDNIHCKACHSPINLNHPDEPIPTDRSTELCGQCHIQAHFEWQESEHRNEGVTCVNCHSQHRTSLKSDSVLDQCAACHETRVMLFTQSEHREAGVSCANCHLAPIEGPVGEGSAKLNHTFSVELSTCLSCHEDQLHLGPADTAKTETQAKSNSKDAMVSMAEAEVSAEPEGVNPLNFVPLLGVAGIVLGMVYRPKIDSWFQSIRRKEK
jgi:hypothetical protein